MGVLHCADITARFMKHDIDVFPDGSHRFAVESDAVLPRYTLSRVLRRGSVDGDGSACDQFRCPAPRTYTCGTQIFTEIHGIVICHGLIHCCPSLSGFMPLNFSTICREINPYFIE